MASKYMCAACGNEIKGDIAYYDKGKDLYVHPPLETDFQFIILGGEVLCHHVYE